VVASDRLLLKRLIREAEGYLELGMPDHVLEVIENIPTKQAGGSHQLMYLKGEALRSLERHKEAVIPLRKAVDLAPSDVHAWLALAWCYKRVGRLRLAVKALRSGLEVEPDLAILHYNLACYYSLLGHKRAMLECLGHAFSLDANYRDMVGNEPDFDPFRNDADFRDLTSVIV